MSQYMSFYLKGRNEYIEIGCFSRSHPIYQAFANLAPYGESAEFKSEDLEAVLEEVEESISASRNLIDGYNEDISAYREMMAKAASVEIYERISEDLSGVKEFLAEEKVELRGKKLVKNWIGTLDVMLDPYLVNPNHLYVGIECEDPNSEE